MIITIDGPAGTGKTTVAKKTAEKLSFHYVDTGAMYRAVTYSLMQKKIPLNDEKGLQSFLEGFTFEMREGKYFAEGLDVTEAIRTPEVTQHVSAVSALGVVRQKLMALQRRLGEGKDAVFEGRDMGTVVFPKATLKIYLTARPAVRAERRYLELKSKHSAVDQERVLQDILTRDEYDSTREISPLAQPQGAHVIDTSDLSIDEVVATIVALVPKRK